MTNKKHSILLSLFALQFALCSAASIASLNMLKANATPGPETVPLTFTATEDGSTVAFNWKSGSDVQYTLDEGETWESYTSGDEITLDIGESVSFKGTGVTSAKAIDASMLEAGNLKKAIDKKKLAHFTMSGKIEASGYVSSLTEANATDYSAVEVTDFCYAGLFEDCEALVTAPQLPAESLAYGCYYRMFANCDSLTTTPEVNPYKPAPYSFAEMFAGCDELKTFTFVDEYSINYASPYAFYGMFRDCVELTQAPELAGYVAEGCYAYMFAGCEKLEQAPSIKLQYVASRCFEGMFEGCKALKIKTYNVDNGFTHSWNIPYDSEIAIMAGGVIDSTNWNLDMFKGCPGVNLGNGSKVPMLGATYYQNIHDWTYDSDDTKITATCNDPHCPVVLTLTLTMDETEVAYTGSSVSADFDDEDGSATRWAKVMGTDNVPTINYTGGDITGSTSTAPTDVGEYTATVTIDSATVSINFEITKETNTSLAFTENGGYEYVVGENEEEDPEVDFKLGLGSDASSYTLSDGDVVYTYYAAEDLETPLQAKPLVVGNYFVKASVADTANYAGAETDQFVAYNIIAKHPITAVTFTEPTAPEATKTAVTALTGIPTDAKYAVVSDSNNANISILWSPALTNGKFAYNTVYTATIILSANELCEFVDPLNTKILDPTDATGATLLEGWVIDDEASTSDKLVLTKTYEATAKQEITAVAFTGFAAPAVGNAPVSDVTVSTTGVTLGSIAWEGDLTDGNFDYDVAYDVTIVLNAGADYVFADTITLTGWTVNLNTDKDELTLTRSYEAMIEHKCLAEYDTYIEGQDATCVVNGWKTLYKCASNEYFYIENDNAIVVAANKVGTWKTNAGLIPAAHNIVTMVETEIPATCVDEGTLAYSECIYCGMKVDDLGYEITGSVVIPALGHDLEVEHNTDKHCYVCKNAGCGYYEQEDHNFSNNAEKCPVCGVVNPDYVAPAAPSMFQKIIATVKSFFAWIYTFILFFA